jgi:hypothetical protein
MAPRTVRWFWVVVSMQILVVGLFVVRTEGAQRAQRSAGPERDRAVTDNARRMLDEGCRVFRFETFGDEAYWGDTLKLHRAIAGAKLGGVGAGVSPKTALSVGLKVDIDAFRLPWPLRSRPARSISMIQPRRWYS